MVTGSRIIVKPQPGNEDDFYKTANRIGIAIVTPYGEKKTFGIIDRNNGSLVFDFRKDYDIDSVKIWWKVGGGRYPKSLPVTVIVSSKQGLFTEEQSTSIAQYGKNQVYFNNGYSKNVDDDEQSYYDDEKSYYDDEISDREAYLRRSNARNNQ